MDRNGRGNHPGAPQDEDPASAYEGRPAPEDVETHADPAAQRRRPTGGIASDAADGVGPDADPADEERKREAGGAPQERGDA